jgi:hypothetical protein
MRRLCLVVFSTFLLSGVGLAQTTTGGSLAGYVTDPQRLPLEGATVAVSMDEDGRRYVTHTDRAGTYRLLDLAPGTYRLTADAAGFRRLIRDGIQVRVGLSLRLDVAMTLGPSIDAVMVRGDTPLVEMRNTAQATNLSGELMRSLPLGGGREWAEFLSITPGVTMRAVGSLSTSHAVRGSDVGSNVVQVDGANIASAALGSTATVNIVPLAIADIQVKTATVDAASPLGVGAVISVATRSGTNRVSGAVALDRQDKKWSSSDPTAGTSGGVAAILPEAALGGPLWRDRVWFFGAYRFERSRMSVPRTADQLRMLRDVAPEFVPFDLAFGGHTALAKVTTQISSRHRGELLYQFMPRETTNATATDAAPFQTLVLGGDMNWGIGITSTWGSRLLTHLRINYSDNAQQNMVRVDRPAQRLFASATATGGRLIGSTLVATRGNGGTGQSGEQRFSRAAMSGDVHTFLTGWGGTHEIQGGVSMLRQHEQSTAVFANGGFAREEAILIDPQNAAAGIRPFWREVWDTTRQPTGLGTSDDIGLYVQDRWQSGSRLVLSAGIRADIIHRVDDLFDVVVQRGTAIGPRLGALYVLTSNSRHALRASWTRVHDALSNNRAAAGASSAGKTDFFDVDLDGVFETQLRTPPSAGVSRNRLFDPTRGQPYIDEWSAGYRGQFPWQVSVDIAFVRRTYRNRTAAVEVNGVYDNGVFRGYRDETQNEVYHVTANRWNWPVYEGVELHAAKRTPTLQIVAGYTRAWRHLAGTWQPNDPAAILQPDAFPNRRGIGGVRAPIPMDANSLSGSHMTIDNLPWLDHGFNAAVAWRGPWGWSAATVVTAQSGTWSGPIVTRLAAADPRYGPPTVRLSSGRMVSNPLSTPIRFAFASRDDGQLRAPALRAWNIRFGRTMWSRGRASLDASVDLFNVMNWSAPTAFAPSANQLFSPDYGRLVNVQPPRAARVLARLAF